MMYGMHNRHSRLGHNPVARAQSVEARLDIVAQLVQILSKVNALEYSNFIATTASDHIKQGPVGLGHKEFNTLYLGQ